MVNSVQVDAVIKVLELGMLADTLVGDEDGGTCMGLIWLRLNVSFSGVDAVVRKRITLGVELVMNPSVLFLDEVTDKQSVDHLCLAYHWLGFYWRVGCDAHCPRTGLSQTNTHPAY